MSHLPAVIDPESLEDRIEDAVDVDATFQSPDGSEINLSESVRKSIIHQNISDELADYISECAVQIDVIRETKLMYGSGDTGRQSQLYLRPNPSVSKKELRRVANELNIILNPVFPSEYLVGITHKNYVDDDGEPAESDEFYVFLVYTARTTSKPSKPPGESTEVIS